MNICYVTVSMGQESGCGLTGCLWIKVPSKVAIRAPIQATVISRPHAERICFCAHSHGQEQAPGVPWCLEASVPFPMGPSLMQLTGALRQTGGRGWRQHVRWKLILEVTSLRLTLFCLLFMRHLVLLTLTRRDYTGLSTRRWSSLGIMLDGVILDERPEWG